MSKDIDLSRRHPSTRQLMRWLVPNPNLTGVAHAVAARTYEYALDLVQVLGDGPELSAGLRKLRESKDCFVIQSLADGEHT